jgi:hypothetical protein
MAQTAGLDRVDHSVRIVTLVCDVLVCRRRCTVIQSRLKQCWCCWIMRVVITISKDGGEEEVKEEDDKDV